MILQDIHWRSMTFDCVRFTHEVRDFNREAPVLLSLNVNLEQVDMCGLASLLYSLM